MEEWRRDENRRLRTCWGHARTAIFCFAAYNLIMSVLGLGFASYAFATHSYYFHITWNAELIQAAIAGCVVLFLVNVGLVVSMFWRVLILMDFWLLYQLFITLLFLGLSGVLFLSDEWALLLADFFILIINWYALKIVYYYYLKIKDNLDCSKKPRVTFEISAE